jgi:hypothetical protein
MTTTTDVDNDHCVAVAANHGCREGLGRLIVQWCRHYKVPISLGFALFEHESGFRKVFGHDPTIFAGAGTVTKDKYLRYREQRRASGNRKMQGVGEGQLTWWETQELCDTRGGCWKAEAQVQTVIETIGARIRDHGYVQGIARYNGSGPAADRYSRDVRAGAARWHAWLS